MTREGTIKALRCLAKDTEFLFAAEALLESYLHESESEKTADEMFRELGYEKERDNEFQTIYKNGVDEIIFAKGRRVVFSTVENGEIAGITYDELRAVCKLLDEMGVE